VFGLRSNVFNTLRSEKLKMQTAVPGAQTVSVPVAVAAAEGSGDVYFGAGPDGEATRTKWIQDRLPDERARAMYLFTSKHDTANVVEYVYNESGAVPTLKPRWRLLDESDVATARVRDETLFPPLSMLQELHMGCALELPSFDVVFNAVGARLPARLVLDDDDTPVVTTTLNGRAARIHHVYVQMRRGLLPDVLFIHVYGYALDDSTWLCEKIVKE